MCKTLAVSYVSAGKTLQTTHEDNNKVAIILFQQNGVRGFEVRVGF